MSTKTNNKEISDSKKLSTVTIHEISSPIHIKLDGSNYRVWSKILEMQIAGRKKKGYITRRKVAPTEDDPGYNEWKAEDALVKLDHSLDQVSSHVLATSPLPSLEEAYSLVRREVQRQVTMGTKNYFEDSALMIQKSTSQVTPSVPVNSTTSNSRFCTHCNSTRHTVDVCWKKHGYSEWYKLKQAEKKNKKYAQIVVTDTSTPSASHVSQVSPQQGNSSLTYISTTSNTWVIDSGATYHMTSNSSILTSLMSSPVKFVQVANRTSMPITGVGNISISPTFLISFVLLAPDLSNSLLSISKITKSLNCSAIFDFTHYVIPQFYKMIVTQFHTQVQVFHYDNGREFINEFLTNFFLEHGILHQTICAYTPQQNGIAERKNRHILEVARALSFTMHVSKRFWAERKRDERPTRLFQNGYTRRKQNATVIPSPDFNAPLDDTTMPSDDSSTINPEVCVPSPTTSTLEKDSSLVTLENVILNPQVMDHDHGRRYPPRERREPDRLDFSKSSFNEALGDPTWKIAMEEQMKALQKNFIWEMVELPLEKKTVGCKWVFTLKSRSDGIVERYKTRLVAKDYTQTCEIDYQETFSPVAKMNIVRVIPSLAVNLDWPVYQFDVKNTFLNGDLIDKVYMDPLLGFTLGGGSNASEIKKLRSYLAKEIKMKDLRVLKYFLDVEVPTNKKRY
ncbi:uncharacterized protein LOC125370622 [Ricinus communis]|uniref:uncharacterized protein LOC125370622 n=1 Tax=Ricinus communis TaxID=3988 RepID=UPI00201B2982|nr:uncharacterized protein LOC125370622 [Ricinus communis]